MLFQYVIERREAAKKESASAQTGSRIVVGDTHVQPIPIADSASGAAVVEISSSRAPIPTHDFGDSTRSHRSVVPLTNPLGSEKQPELHDSVDHAGMEEVFGGPREKKASRGYAPFTLQALFS